MRETKAQKVLELGFHWNSIQFPLDSWLLGRRSLV